MKKILVITYYWPPSGGAGVQRTLKFVKYFPKFGIHPVVITVDPEQASYPVVDVTLKKDVAPDLEIYYTDSFEPLNILGNLVGKNKVPYGGFANKNKETLFQTGLRWIRGNFFIPDARIGWVKYALKKATEIIQSENISTVYISSPPHSTQLIGLALKKKFPNLRWIADMRDPWTDIYYYKDLLHTPPAKRKDARYERMVLEQADQIVVVSDSIRKAFASKSAHIDIQKIQVIANGFDEDDFKNLEATEKNNFYITYVGTMADTYKPEVFFEVLKSLIQQFPEKKIRFRFIGSIPWTVKEITKKLDIEASCEWIGHVNHDEAIRYMQISDVLLLIIPDAPGAEGILTGKLFEYMGTGRLILGLGPKQGDAAGIIKECNAGRMFERNEKETLKAWLQDVMHNGSTAGIENYTAAPYERKKLTEKLVKLF
ncbi:glycosyltransferase family 4 protein [soil metagenome]